MAASTVRPLRKMSATRRSRTRSPPGTAPCAERRAGLPRKVFSPGRCRAGGALRLFPAHSAGLRTTWASPRADRPWSISKCAFRDLLLVMMLQPQVTFAKDKPFYWLVTTFLAAIHGYLELVSRGVKQRVDSMPAIDLDDLVAGIDERHRDDMRLLLNGGVTGLLGKQNLPSTTGPPLRVDLPTLANELLNSETSINYVSRSAASALLLLAWDLTAAEHTSHPTWEFLRHCRNGAAHDGRRAGEVSSCHMICTASSSLRRTFPAFSALVMLSTFSVISRGNC